MGELIEWLPAVVAIIAAAASVVGVLITRSGGRQARREPTWGELLGRVGALEEKVDILERQERRKMGAVLRILRAIARQWPTPTGPDLDPRDIELIEEAVPYEWIRQPHKKETT